MELFSINDLIAVATRPRGGDWLRDDLAAAQLRGVQRVVSGLTREEESELGLEGELETAGSLGLKFSRAPIEDFGIPRPGIIENVLSQISQSGTSSEKIAINFRQGLGRSPLVAAAMLVWDAMTPGEAWDVVAVARGQPVPETEEQRAWLSRFAAS